MTYLFLGEDNPQKESQLSDLKKKWLTSPEAFRFDWEVLYGYQLDPHKLQKALLALPAVAEKRLVFIREIERLNEHNQDFLVKFVATPQDHLILILESRSLGGSDSFVQKIHSFVKVAESRKTAKDNVFNMTRAMTGGQDVQALKILSELLSDGTHPLQIMGGIVWAWGEQRGRLGAERFEKGLHALQEADLNIKRSRLQPDHTLEILIVKLAVILR